MLLAFNLIGIALLVFVALIVFTANGWIQPIGPIVRLFTALVRFHDRWL